MKVIVTFCIYFISTITWSAETNCQNKVTNAYWNELSIQAANNMGITNLVNLRKQLCRQIGTGEITAKDAKKIFNRERSLYVDDLDLERSQL